MDTYRRRFRVLLIGSGAREHALAWRMSYAPSVEHVFVCPGNGGTMQSRKITNIVQTHEIKDCDYSSLVSLAEKLRIGLVVVGSDNPAVDDMEAYFREKGIPCFSPSKEAARIGGDKTYAKNFMGKYRIPTAPWRSFDLSTPQGFESAVLYIEKTEHDVVLKANGPTEGKGVMLPACRQEAHRMLNIFAQGKFGPAGRTVVVERCLEGEEVSVSTFSDGTTFRTLPPGQDHKRLCDGNVGPNTRGMGVCAPTPIVTPRIMSEIEKFILKPTFDGLRAEGRTFRGLLSTRIMITPLGPHVLGYNARFEDPETQSLMLLLSNETDLAEVFFACTQGSLHTTEMNISPGYACSVVISALGYPGSYLTDNVIRIGAVRSPHIYIFHGDTKSAEGDVLKSTGGRVISVAAVGDTLEQAVKLAYEGVASVRFEEMHFRTDIASRLLRRR
ncbi:Phosphoribosylglycinamide synthetase [Metarhizium album ARSEF 1941]|uniref:phosphoribosylamine--glycine ligase n=1 Tax=Metarhizium album (strain ARSEF 1941) TaxID=1081103 RepID=A0A0B2WQV5_METAS|nr:Phosphoribosylglycinamide synthetase [Metarhizium album ARSEF 1941]KHN96014.1 Phosphoribosylglycinamide synthetase [Metarhizium album ARSEF 1941]